MVIERHPLRYTDSLKVLWKLNFYKWDLRWLKLINIRIIVISTKWTIKSNYTRKKKEKFHHSISSLFIISNNIMLFVSIHYHQCYARIPIKTNDIILCFYSKPYQDMAHPKSDTSPNPWRNIVLPRVMNIWITKN